jgi:hypothetical protein
LSFSPGSSIWVAVGSTDQTTDRADVAVTIGNETAYEDGSVVTDEFKFNSNKFPTEIQAGSTPEIIEENTNRSGDTEVEILYLPTDGNTATLASQTLEFN